MTSPLEPLLRALEPASEANLAPRLRFGLVCVERVGHLMEQDDVLACLAAFRDRILRGAFEDALADASKVQVLANSHQGSRSLDGVGHAAVSATYALAKAVAGQARQAAEYAAYAAVYGQGGYGATSDPASFVPEQEWQAQHLRNILQAVGE
ncbi:hypothetical protein ACPWT1_00190 [Ramlibacter sp. MMS24-I3-19]|uniref:hypothetical protein n=1 Tax=Ramlibacter sp. MMS24-I3-19 TaxID=3416606 RepID=UPI003D06778E